MNYFESNIKQNNDLARKRPKQGRSKFTVDSILEAATRILIADGYASFNTNRVAEVAGVSVGSLYQYFPNKEAIVAALWERHSEHMRGKIFSRLQEVFHLDLSTIMKEMITAVIEAHRVDKKIHRILLVEVPQVDLSYINENANMESLVAFRDLILSKKDEVRDDLNIDLALRIIHVLVENVTHDAVVSSPELLDGDILIEEIHRMVMQYLQ